MLFFEPVEIYYLQVSLSFGSILLPDLEKLTFLERELINNATNLQTELPRMARSSINSDKTKKLRFLRA